MRRVIYLYLPTWPTDHCRKRKEGFYRPDAPLITAVREGNRRLIAATDRLAYRAGLRVGQTITHASALVPNLQIADANLAEDEKALHRLALWCLKRYSPLVGVDLPTGLWIDAAGCSHRFGDEKEMIADLQQHLKSVSIGARASIADTTGAAYAMARYARQQVVERGAHKDAMHHLPVKALRLPHEIYDGLSKLGFDYIGKLYDVARAPLARRFGPELMRRYDQALGAVIEPINPIAAPEIPSVKRFFSEPVTSQGYIEKVLSGLIEELCQNLESRGLGSRIVDIIANRVDNRIVGVRVGVGRSSRDPRHLMRLLTDKISMIDTGFGIEVLEIRATQAEAFQHRQVSNALDDSPEVDTSGLVDVLLNRVGSQNIYSLKPLESSVPERTIKKVSASKSQLPNNWPTRWPRPIRVLHTPENVRAMALLPDHAPTAFVWRRQRYQVVRSDGPERLFGEWWKRKDEIHSVRDYFLVEDNKGKRFWIFRRGDGTDLRTGNQQWFMHGFFA